MKKFVLIGAAGYVAPRHMKAIKSTGNSLIAALDVSDSVGVIDSYFPNAAFFTEFERFDRFVSKQKSQGTPIDYVAVCSPNYLHDAHIRFGLRLGAHVICEKPLVLNPWNLTALKQIEEESETNINTILQLRLHPEIIKLKEQVDRAPDHQIFDVDLSYITSRGNWYYASWKGNLRKSGGIATNIGIHFFDMLSWIFGEAKNNTVHVHSHDRAAGFLELERARVRWFLSINPETLPPLIKEAGIRTYRSITVNDREIEFSKGFTDLHTRSYEAILQGKGFRLDDASPSINLVSEIRNSKPIGLQGDYHPMASLPPSAHPFAKEEMATAF